MPSRPATPTKTIKTGVLYRDALFQREAIDEEARAVELSFSSEEPYERFFGIEILDHSPKSVRLERLASGRAPLLFGHNPNDYVGVIEEARIGSDRRGHAKVRFGSSERAEQVFRDVIDGILTNISVGYVVHELAQTGEPEENGTPVLRVTDWEPLEVSVVTIPADPSVGVGRNKDLDSLEVQTVVLAAETPTREESNTKEANRMADEIKDAPAPAETPVDVERVKIEVRDREVARVRELAELGAKYNCREKADEFIKGGNTPDNFRKWILDHKDTLKDSTPLQTPVESLLTPRERDNYSIMRVIRALANRDYSKVGVEKEVSDEIARRVGREPNGFFIAPNMLARDLTTSNGGGSNLIGTDHRADAFIELLRNRAAVLRLGARVLSGLVGDVDIPRQSGGATAYWINNESADTTESNQSFNKITLSPKTVSARTDVTRKMLLQSSPSVEALVSDDLVQTIALAVDSVCIMGGGSGQPTGIIPTVSGTAAQRVETGSNLLTYGDFVEFETKVSAGNADVGTLAYLTTPEVRGRAKQIAEFANTGLRVWTDSNTPGEGMVNGYQAFASNQVPKNLTGGVDHGIIFANFADLLVGEWGAVDLFVDPYTLGDRGAHVLRIFFDVDCALRHNASFVVSVDADPNATS